MRDFDDKHMMRNLDDNFKRVGRIAVFVIIGGWILGLSTLGFIGWVIIKVNGIL